MNSGTRALAAALLFAGAACASAAEWGVQQLMGGLAQVKSAKARYTERKTVALLSAPLDSEGTLVYTAPGRLEKRTTAPRPESLLLDGDRLTLESQGKRRTFALQAYPVIWAFVESIRSTLAGDLNALTRNYSAGVAGDASRWRLTLRPLDPSLSNIVEHVEITGSQGVVRTVEIFQADGDRSLMTLTPLEP